jgi:hypothetical protein
MIRAALLFAGVLGITTLPAAATDYDVPSWGTVDGMGPDVYSPDYPDWVDPDAGGPDEIVIED